MMYKNTHTSEIHYFQLQTHASGIKKKKKKNMKRTLGFVFSSARNCTIFDYLHTAWFYFIQYQFLTMGLGLIKITAEPVNMTTSLGQENVVVIGRGGQINKTAKLRK